MYIEATHWLFAVWKQLVKPFWVSYQPTGVQLLPTVNFVFVDNLVVYLLKHQFVDQLLTKRW